MKTYAISDSNSSDTELTFDEAVERIAEWYADCDTWDTGKGNKELHDAIRQAIDSVEQPDSGGLYELQQYADSICQAVAEACGQENFAGHGNYNVSAADRGGFRLEIEKEPVLVSVYDSSPATSGRALEDIQVEIDDDEEPAEAIRRELEIYACGLSTDMGYEPGDRLWATWDDEDGIQQQVIHALTDEDLS